jgi:hypothetical protein
VVFNDEVWRPASGLGFGYFSNSANSRELKQFATHQPFLSKFDSADHFAGCLQTGTPYLQLQSRHHK